MVSAAQVALIKDTWSGITPQKAGDVFYAELAKCAPDSYAVFNFGGDKAKVSAQGEKVMNFVDAAVKGLDDMDGVVKKLDELAQRHTKYGAKKAHFPGAGDALLHTIKELSGGKWSADAEAAWKAFYAVISKHITAPLA